jgi:hypothetical protein
VIKVNRLGYRRMFIASDASGRMRSLQVSPCLDEADARWGLAVRNFANDQEPLFRRTRTLYRSALALAGLLLRNNRRCSVRRERSRRRPADGLDAIARHCAALPALHARSADEIIGCEKRGMPR